MDASNRKEKLCCSTDFASSPPSWASSWFSAWASPAQSQSPASSPPPAQDQQSQAPAEDDNLQTFKAQVNVVNLFFNVKDKHGMLIPNLTKD